MESKDKFSSNSNDSAQQKNDEKSEDKKNLYDDSIILCKICLTNRIDTIITPCYHACLCHDCWDKMPVPKRCPVCRGFVINTLHVIIDS